MQNSRLIQLLKSLSPSELREFKDFVNSPLYNKNKKIILLFDALRKFYPEFDHPDLSNEKVFYTAFGSGDYDYFNFKNLISDLLALGKEYLTFLQFRKDRDKSNILLLSELRDRNLDKLFEQTFKSLDNKLESENITDERFYLKKLELTEEILSYRIPKDPDSRFDYLQDELNFFLKYSVIRLLKFYNLMLHEKEQNNCNFTLEMFEGVMDYIRTKEEDNPTLLIYYNIILLNIEKKEKYFFNLKKLKEKYFDNLNNGDRFMLFLHLANYCAYVYNVLGKKDFMKEHFLISKENYERGTIFLGKVLYPDFLNHVKIAVRVNEFEWAENFINEFSHLLTEEKQSTLNFCHGFISYKKGNLETALELFSKTKFQSFIIKVQVKILILQINYEMGYYVEASANIDSFRHYLSRENSMVVNFKESYFDFLRNLNDLIKLKSGEKDINDKANLKLLKNNADLIKFNQFGIKIWLREKVDEIIKN
ncbi:MAG: hypothetical protein KDD00_10455 [Ignavibacteriae bacterium]|nr:hypothetical protein [Ignavibacteriota bacterium]